MTMSERRKLSGAESGVAAQSSLQKIVCDNAQTVPSDVALVESIPRTSHQTFLRRNVTRGVCDFCCCLRLTCYLLTYLLTTYFPPLFLLRSAYDERTCADVIIIHRRVFVFLSLFVFICGHGFTCLLRSLLMLTLLVLHFHLGFVCVRVRACKKDERLPPPCH